MERKWKDTNDKNVKSFRVLVTEKGEAFSIKASSQTNVYDFKRLILTEKKLPFFLEEDIPNTMSLA